MKSINGQKPRVNQSLARATRDIGQVRIRVSIDTVELFCRIAPAGLRTRLEAAVGRRIEIKPCLDATGYRQGWRAIINRPNRRVLTAASELLRASESACVFRVDVAVDFETVTERSTDVLASFLDRHLVLKWRPATSTKQIVGSTVYWANGCRSRNLAMYYKRARTTRLELRFLNSRSVWRAKLADPANLRRLNPTKILEHNLKLVALTDRYIRNAVRKAVSKDRKQHMKERLVKLRTPRTELFTDQYRSRTAARVERIILRGIDMQKRRSAYRSTSLDRFRLSEFLNIPSFLTWPPDPEQPSPS